MKNSGIEWIGEIPDSWELQPLRGHLTEVKESNDPIQTTQVLSLTNKLGVIPYEEKGEQGNKSKENYNEYKLAYPNTIVANSMNILIGSVGICNYFGCVSPVYYVFKPNDEQELKFLDYIFQSQPFQKELRRYAKGILEIRLRVSANDILRRQVAFPSSQQQKKIVDFLEAKLSQVDELIANQQGQIEKLKEYKQSVITEAVTKGLDKSAPMKDSNLSWIIGKVPAHWAVVNPKALFSLRRERAKEGERQLTASQQYGVIYQDDYMRLTGSRIVVVMKDFDILKHVEKGDFVISMRSFQGGLEYSENEGSISSAYVMLKPNREYVVDHFYKWLFKSSLYINALQSTSDLIRDGQAMRYSNFTQLWLYQIPLKEQEQIASYLDKKCADIDKLIAIKQEKIEKLQEYKKSLIYEYVTGKKEVV